MSPYNWHFQSEQMQKMLESGQFSDVTLVVSEPPEQKEEEAAEQTKRKKIKVHRNILAANSPVFAAMFSHEETSEDLKKEVIIEDVSPETMDRFLSYIYTGSLKGDWTDDEGPFLELLAAADKYQVDPLKFRCENLLSSQMTLDSVCTILQSADLHNAPTLKERCLGFIVSNSDRVISQGEATWQSFKRTARSELIDDLVYRLAAKKIGS